jgi:hypothetical protein
MKRNIVYLSLIAFLFTLSSCDLIAGVFKGGFYFGIIAVLVVIGLVIWLIRKAK